METLEYKSETKLMNLCSKTQKIKLDPTCGFKGVLLDLEGYRQGSLNEDINTGKQ